MSDALPSLVRQVPYDQWTEDQLWQIFLDVIRRDCPLADVDARLMEYRALFSAVCEQMLYEHRFLLGTHFRTAQGKPFINPLNIEHLTRLMHLFSRRIFVEHLDVQLLDALFYVLKTRCNINIFYTQPVGRFFFGFHALGAVVAFKAEQSDFMVVLQGTTIGQSENQYPLIGNNLLLGPGAMILGNCRIGNNVRLAAGALVVNRDIPDNTLVLGLPSDQVLKPNPIDNRMINFDMDALERRGEL